MEQRAHVSEVRNRHANFANFASGQNVVGVVTRLGRQVERNRQTRLALSQVHSV